MQLFDDLAEEITHSGCEEAGWCQPLVRCMRFRLAGKTTPPYIPQWDLAPLHQLCQRALLWHAAGFSTEAGQLAHFLHTVSPFPTLWCPENQFSQQKVDYWFSRLASVDPVPGPDPDDLVLHPTAAFTLTGQGTTLGVFKSQDVEIRAMGPQTPSLHFGIKGKGNQNWTRTQAYPEIWFHTNTAYTERECKMDLRFIGLNPETPLEFAFYVKASTCQIAGETLKPKSLRRFNGEASAIQFSHLQLLTSIPHKVRIIPLAGQGCFWDTQFLAAIEIPPFDSQLHLTIKNLAG